MNVHFLTLITMIFPLLFSACREDNPSNEGQILYTNASIYTVNTSAPWAEAMLVENGTITAIGTESTVLNLAGEDAKILDMNGRFIMPGIHDVHMHPLEASSSNFDFTISDEVEDPEDYYNDILAASDAKSGNDWLLGWGHFIHTVLDAERTPKDILDDISTERPIAIMESTSHSFWVNSKALEVAGINNASINPIGGIIMRDFNNEPNGILIDNAGNILLDMVLTASTEREQKDYDGMVDYGFLEIAKYGITSISDARTYWKRNHHKTWQRLADDKKMTARTNLGIWIYPNLDDDVQIENIKSLYDNDDSDFLRSNQIKVYIDGIIPNTTAAMHDDYKFDLFGGLQNNGLNYITQERLEKYISALEPIGYDFHIHAIGNRGIHEALNAIENAGNGTGRHRITHCEIIDPQDYPRFHQLNVTADCQVAGEFTNPEHWHENDEYIEANLSNNFIPIKSLLENEARLTLSSDWDVSNLSPFVGIQNAISRSPQNINIEEAIRAYTINAAYIMRQENKVGSLEIGKEADFIVLNQNILDISNESIAQTKVLDTYLNGIKVN